MHTAIRRHVKRADAIKYFTDSGAENTANLVIAITENYIECYCCELPSGIFMALNHGPLVQKTSAVEPHHFRISAETIPSNHFRIYYAATNPESGVFELAADDRVMKEAQFLSAYNSRKAWNSSLNFDTVSKINDVITSNQTKSLVQLSEALHDHQLVDIAR